MDLRRLIREKRSLILEIASRYGAKDIRVFGSVARGDSGQESDLDLLVELEEDRSLFDLGGFQMEMQELLGCMVDVVTEQGLHWFIRDRVLAEAEPL